MTMRLHAAQIAALVALAAFAALDAARANHYILPCSPECRDAGDVTIGPGFTGTWADSSQSSQTVSIEVLPGPPLQMFAVWFAFRPDGGQAWIMGRGPLAGTQAILQATQTLGSGGVFPPNFDPANVREQAWGTLTLTFSDCEHGRIDWASTVAGYGNGSMDLVRLTTPAGLTCTESSNSNAMESGDTSH